MFATYENGKLILRIGDNTWYWEAEGLFYTHIEQLGAEVLVASNCDNWECIYLLFPDNTIIRVEEEVHKVL